jgi:hypothetical protein
MRLIYVDTALAHEGGHHANYCRLVAAEMKARDLPFAVYALREIDLKLKADLGATPLFRWGTYKQMYAGRDAISGWLRDFDLAWRTTLDDLRKIETLRPDDVVYFSAALPAQFMAAVQWMWQTPLPQRPRVVIEFASEPGLQVVQSVGGRRHFEVPDPRQSSRAMLYHHVATMLQPEDQSRLRIVTFDRGVSDVFQGLLGCPVGVIPLPLHAITDCRPSTGKRPITISVLGHQRPEKGFQFMPEVLKLLADLQGVEFLIHNSAPNEMAVPQNAIRELAQTQSNIRMNEEAAHGPKWTALLEATDLALCPYDPIRYSTTYSGVQSDCLANGIPAVLPGNSRLSAISQEFGGVSADFAEWSAPSIASAVREAVEKFDFLADRATAAAKKWATMHGSKQMVDALLAV